MGLSLCPLAPHLGWQHCLTKLHTHRANPGWRILLTASICLLSITEEAQELQQGCNVNWNVEQCVQAKQAGYYLVRI